MNELISHRGPDGHATWTHANEHVGFAHRRLTIIDLETGDQPMRDGGDNWITYNGEIYNYLELRAELGARRFRTSSDTEVILEAYRAWGPDCLLKLRGMFAFALWDEASDLLFCARDRFGIKPLYYTVVDGVLYFASEIKALLPFLPTVETDIDGFKDYLSFQFCLGGQDALQGRSRSCCRATSSASRTDTSRPGATGRSTTSPTSVTRPRTSRSRSGRSCRSRSRSTSAPTCPSARTSAAASTRA